MFDPPAFDEDGLLDAFEDCTFPRKLWRHRPHVTVAYLYLREHSLEETCEKLRDGIQRYNTAFGVPMGYHETATMFWAHLIQFTMAAHGPSDSARNFFNYHSYLLNKMLPLHYYSRERIMSLDAKERFLLPDLQPLPALSAVADAEGLTLDPLPVPIPPDPVRELVRTGQVLATNPDDALATYERAIALSRTGDLEWAARECHRFVALDPTLKWGWFSVGHVFEMCGLKDEAKAAMERFQQLR